MVEASGFKKSPMTRGLIDAGTPATVNVALEVGARRQTVTVVGVSALMQSRDDAIAGITGVLSLT
jgi:hypothetical protein